MQQISSLFESLGDQSRVWLYVANRRLSNDEVHYICKELNQFNARWSAHGKKLHSEISILFNHVIVFAVDESIDFASGCSIDSSVREIKKLSVELKIDFFNRMQVMLWKDEKVQLVPYSYIKKNKGLRYLNPLVSTLGELREKWLIQS